MARSLRAARWKPTVERDDGIVGGDHGGGSTISAVVGFLVLITFGLLIATAVVARRGSRQVQPTWAPAARELGIPAPPLVRGYSQLSMSGTVEGRHLSVRECVGDGTSWIEFELGLLRELPAGLEIEAASLGSIKPGTAAAGGDRMLTGDAHFDGSFIVTGGDPMLVQVFLDAERRRALLDLAHECPGFRIRNGEMTYRFPGLTERLGNVAVPARAMIDAARTLTAPKLEAP